MMGGEGQMWGAERPFPSPRGWRSAALAGVSALSSLAPTGLNSDSESVATAHPHSRGWQRGQTKLLLLPVLIFSIGAPQTGQGLPSL